jgi:ATP-binding cassette, subfamily C, bacterial LapB
MSAAAAERLTLRASEPLVEALRRDGIGDFRALSPFAACLTPLLSALDFRGSRRRLLESLPHFANDLDLVDLRSVLSELGFPTTPLRVRLDELDPRLAPCLFVSGNDEPLVVIEPRGTRALVVPPDRDEPVEIDVGRLVGTAYIVERATKLEAPPEDQPFSEGVLLRFRPLVWQLLAVTLVIDLITISAALASMLIYDKVIGMRATDFLAQLVLGLCLLFVGDAVLRGVRTRVVAYIGARIDRLVGVATLKQLLSLPLTSIESVPVGTQAARLKEFEGLREFFTGPLAQLVLEMPFLIIAIAVLGFMAGPLAVVPVVLTLVFALIGWLIFAPLKRSIAVAGRARSQRHGFIVEMLGGLRAIRQTGVEEIWLDRYRQLSAETAAFHDKAQQWSLLMQTLSQILVLAAGVACLAIGVSRVLGGGMTVGALVATMAILWRVTGPLQTLLILLPRFEGLLRTMHQIDGLMRLKPGRPPVAPVAHVERVFRGDVQAVRISHRYRNDNDPALLAAELAAKRGEIVAVVGPSGSGKSTLLKIIAGLYQPQGGAVTIDGIDIRQLPPGDLQRALCYLPQNSHLFHGTIEQNLRLADPTASTHDLMMALSEAGALEEVQALKEGLETRIGDQRTQRLPAGLLQRLSLARVLLSGAPIMLLDEPGQSLDDRGDAALKEVLAKLRGRRTVIIVTHRPSHIQLCDRVVMLQEGRVTKDAPAAEFMKAMKGPGK